MLWNLQRYWIGSSARGTLREMDTKIPMVVRMLVDCENCGHHEDETFEFDLPFRKARPNGRLISPEGIDATSEDVIALPFMHAQIAAYQAEQRRVQGMDEQPEPGSAAEFTADRALRG